MAKRRVSHALAAVALLLSALLFVSQSYADSNVRIVRLSDVDGSVQIDRNTGHGFEKAILNMPITQGVRLETGTTGRAEVEFENGSAIRLAGDSSMEFTELSLRSDGERVSDMRVDDGLIYVNFKHKGDDDFRISFGNRSFDLTKDVHLRLNVSRSTAELAVLKGEVQIQGSSESAKVKKNETLTWDLSDGARYELAKGVTRYPDDDWDEERTQYLNEYAARRQYDSPYVYGYSDLNRYGAFFDAPGYGLLWRPSNIGFGWDPYGNGYWSYYPGYGYVWVSSYPWGWTPYRYGSWVFVPTYGWCWRPGGWNRWNTGINVHNPPPAWRHPNPPATGGGTTVVVGQPPKRTPRTIQTEDLSPRHPVPPASGTVSGGTVRPDRNPRTGSNPTPPVQGNAAPVSPTNTIQPTRDPRVMIDRKTGTFNDRAEQQNLPAARRGPTEPRSIPPAVNQTPKLTTAPPPSAPRPSTPPQHVQPVRPTSPTPRAETPPAAPPPSPRMERPSRMESMPHASPPPSARPPAPSRSTNPK